MRRYTVQDILALRPCQPTEDRPDAGYPESKLHMLFGARRSVTLLEICDDDRVPIMGRQWVLHRLLPEPLVHEVACRYAERALARERTNGRDPDPRSWAATAAIAAKRMWLRGEIPNGELEASRSAARAAADAVSDARTSRTSRAAACAASCAASREAASAAVCSSAWAASQAATWAAVKTATEGVDWDAAWGAAWNAERRWQLDTIREMIEAMEDRTHQRKGNP